MLGLIGAVILLPIGVMALRSHEVRWRFAIPFGMIPALFAYFMGIIGIVIGAVLIVAYWKMKLD